MILPMRYQSASSSSSYLKTDINIFTFFFLKLLHFVPAVVEVPEQDSQMILLSLVWFKYPGTWKQNTWMLIYKQYNMHQVLKFLDFILKSVSRL